MKVSQLIDELQELVEEGYGDLELVNIKFEDLSDIELIKKSEGDFIILHFE